MTKKDRQKDSSVLNRMDESIHILQKTDSDESVLFLLDRWLGEMNLRLAHVFAGGYGDAALLVTTKLLWAKKLSNSSLGLIRSGPSQSYQCTRSFEQAKVL